MQEWAHQAKTAAFGRARSYTGPNLVLEPSLFIDFCYGSEGEVNENVLPSDFTNGYMVLSFFTVL